MKNGKGKIILLLIISIISITKVNALELTHKTIGVNDITGYDNQSSGTYKKNNLNFNNDFTFTYDFTDSNNFLRITGYDYINFGVVFHHQLLVNGSSQQYNSDNGNLQYYCSRYVNTYQTYADGTQSLISVCDEWTLDIENSQNVNSNSNYSYQYKQPIYTYIDLIFTNGEVSPCISEGANEGSYYVTCKIPNNANYLRQIRVRNVGNSYNNVTLVGMFGLQNNITIWKDPTNIISSNQQDTTNAINDMTNADYNEPTEQPNATDFNNYQEKEQTLEDMASADMTAVNIGLNANASNWIWTIINRIINVNPIIMAFYITILSIGVIKLIMRR